MDAEDWLVWGAANGIAPEVLFFIQLEPMLLHQFDPQSKEKAFPCPRTWKFTSNIVHRRNGLDPAVERALFRGTIGEAAAVEFCCPARGLRADRRDKLLKWLDTGGQNRGITKIG